MTLEEEINDSRFHGALTQRYGLLETPELKKRFANQIAEFDVHLATYCLISEVPIDEEIKRHLSQTAIENITFENEDPNDPDEVKLKSITNGYLALIELGEFERIADYITKYKLNGETSANGFRNAVLETPHSRKNVIVELVDKILNSKTPRTISHIIKVVDKSHYNFTFEEKDLLATRTEDIRAIFNSKDYNDPSKILKFIFAFNLPRDLFPNDWEQLLEERVRNTDTEFPNKFFEKYNLENTFTDYRICKLLLELPKEQNILKLKDYFFNLNQEESKQILETIESLLKRHRLLAAFCLYLLGDEINTINRLCCINA
jgi:hypothetical protein